MNSSHVDINTPDGTANAYLTRPEGEAPAPGVLFLIDAFGLRPRIEEMADRIASHGYTVLAPNVFFRAGRDPVGPLPDMSAEGEREQFFEKLRPLMGSLTPATIVGDGRAYLDYLTERAPGPVAITGYCLGTRLGLRIAADQGERVAAVGGFHGGGLVTGEPDSPHRLAPSIRAELYFGHADHDRSNTPEQIAELEHALDEAGVRYASELYEGAAHGYTMSDTPSYDEAACERHFGALLGLLERTLGSSAAV